MEEQKNISDYIMNYLQEDEETRIIDPVLAQWLGESKSNKEDFERYKKIWKDSRSYVEPETFDRNKAWAKIDVVNRRKENFRRHLKQMTYVVSGVAASLLVMFVLSFMGVLEKGEKVLVSMAADYGSRSEITLPDGSVVKLNSGSKVTYSYDSEEKIREVSFEGEGFFDVSKSKEPFVIRTAGGLDVKVWGTSFNLQAYPDNPVVEASLVEGCIELVHHDKKWMMKPGEMAAFDKHMNEFKPVKGVVSHSYGWLDNKLYMDNMTLAEVCRNLSRWYNVHITIEGDLGNKIYYNGVIKEETITDVMEALSRLSNITYHVKGKNISITSK
ncbi:FecR family protein [Parabacteroides pacaensis]|uniref:FecR family protein n=1 Tax=Parabacteroides pacaensis TaxID=2086575 RepID=UPI000D111C54|nr:FecR family protein [Parabacteroides pacaensis]